MFFGGMRESQPLEAGIEVQTRISALDVRQLMSLLTPQIKDVSYPVFMKLLEYLYTDTVEDIPPSLAVPLLIAAERVACVNNSALVS